MGLDGLVERLQRRFGRGVLGDVRRRSSVPAVVENLGGALGGQAGELDLDVAIGDGVRDALVRPDRNRPDRTVFRIGDGFLDRVAADAPAERRRQNPLRVEPGEHLPEPVAGGTDQRFGLDPNVVEEHGELMVRRGHRRLQQLECDSRRIGGYHEERQRVPPTVRSGSVPRHHEQCVRFVGGGDEVFAAGHHPPVAVLAGGGLHLVTVGPGIRFGQRKRHLQRAVGDAGQPALLHLGRAMSGQDRTADGGRDDRQEQRNAMCGQFFDDDGQLGHACAATAVFLGQVHPE